MNQRLPMRKIVAEKLYKKKSQDEYVLTQPVWVRIFHWGFALSMIMVVLTGLELYRPFTFVALNYGQVFVVHMTFAFLALGLVIFRLVDMLIRKDSSLLLTLNDLKSFPQLIAYYFFLKPSPPPSGKYNSGQKLIFSSWIITVLIASFLGLASYWMDEHLVWVKKFIGGWQVLRFIKFTTAIYFAATIPVHLYLSFSEGPSRLQAMFTGYERVEKPKP